MDWMVERRCPAALLAVSIVLGAAAPLTLAQAAGRAPAAEMAPDPDQATEGRLLVVNRRDNTLMVIDVPSYAIQATIPVGQEPHEVVVTPDGRKAYVSNGRDRTISVVDLKGPRVVRTLRSESFDSLNGLAMTPDGRHLILTSEGSRRFFLVDASRDVVLRSLTTTQARAHMVVVPGNGTRAFAANVGSDSVTILKIPELRIVKNVPVGDGPEGIAVTPNGRWVLVALQGVEQVAILDADSGAVLARLPTGRTPIRIAVTPNSFTALVTNRASNDVTVLDILARRVKTTIRVGQGPGGVTTNPAGSRAFVGNSGSNSVSVISVPGFEVLRTIAVGASPDGIAFVPARGDAGRKHPHPRSSGG